MVYAGRPSFIEFLSNCIESSGEFVCTFFDEKPLQIDMRNIFPKPFVQHTMRGRTNAVLEQAVLIWWLCPRVIGRNHPYVTRQAVTGRDKICTS